MRFRIVEVAPGRIGLTMEGELDRAQHAEFSRRAAAVPGVRAAYTRWSRRAVTLLVDPKAPQQPLVERVEAVIRAVQGEPAEEREAPSAGGSLPDILERRAREIEAQITRLQQELREVTRKRDRLRAVVGVYERALAAERRAQSEPRRR